MKILLHRWFFSLLAATAWLTEGLASAAEGN
jgi:hypothetical protein